jgi:hypothetical protein
MAKRQKAKAFNPFAPSTSKKSEARILNDEHDENATDIPRHYKNVMAGSVLDLDKAVNIEIQAGWRPMGNMTVIRPTHSNRGGALNPTSTFSQTMVKGIVVEVLSFPPED